MKLMRRSLLIWLVFVMNINATELTSLCCQPKDYEKLVDIANLISFSYCLKKGLRTGPLGDEETNCKLETCQQPQYSSIDVVKVFNFNDLGSVGSGYCALDNNRKTILLVFRGTASRRDWISNIDFLPTKYQPISSDGTLGDLDYECDDCKVHRGFYNILKTSMVPIIEKILALKEKHPEYQLWVIGHSLGGALTFLTGLEFQLLGLNPLVVSFANPKIGDKNLMEFADRHFKTTQVAEFIDKFHDFNRGYIRVTHKGDIVPQLPPSIFYHHSGYEYFINKKDLPQNAENLVRKGPINFDDCEDEVEAANIGNPTKYWPAAFLKNEHVSYFIRISGCDD